MLVSPLLDRYPMANIASVLKEEISRQARKELRGETENLKKASSRHRSEIAALKRRVAMLEQAMSRMEKLLNKVPACPSTAATPTIRFSADGLKKHRERLGLSAAKLGAILGVSVQTIYNWEAGTTRPNRDQVAKIAVVRKMGKREIKSLLPQAK